MTVQTSWSACLKLYALQVSIAWLKYSCIAIFTASTGVPMLFKNIFLTASKSTVGPLRLQDHLYNCRKANSWTTVSWTSSLPLQKIKQLNHYDFKTTFRTAKNKQFYQCVWKVIFTTVEKKVTLRQQVNNCNSFQDMELHYMNMYTTAMHQTTTRRRLQCIPSHETAHYINTQTTAEFIAEQWNIPIVDLDVEVYLYEQIIINGWVIKTLKFPNRWYM